MNEKFFDLPMEKQQNIINASMAVFGKHEYKRATTDEIVRRAGISKGLLFHYFENKKGLYLYTYQYAEQVLKQEMGREFDYSETDLFQILVKSQMCKVHVMKRYPDLFDFLTRSYLEKDEAVAQKLDRNFREIIAESNRAILTRVDIEKFKDHVNPETVLNMVLWMAEGFMKSRSREELSDLEKLNEEFLGYVELLRRHFYKEEYI